MSAEKGKNIYQILCWQFSLIQKLWYVLTLAKDRTAIIDGCTTAALEDVVVDDETALRTANRDAAVRAAEENMAAMYVRWYDVDVLF